MARHQADVTSFFFLFHLLWLLLVTPFMLVTVILVYRRRHVFPLAGRGSTLLLVQSFLLLLSTVVCGLLQLFFPDGLPCGLLFIVLYVLSVPQAVIYLTKGWIFVVRLEILEYLDELHWREQKQATLLELVEKERAKLEAAVQAKPPSLAVPRLMPSSHINAANSHVLITVAPTSAVDQEKHPVLLELEQSLAAASELCSAECSTLPGYFFIQHRRWTEWKFLKRVYLFVGVFFTCAFVLICALDMDPELTDAVQRGEVARRGNSTVSEPTGNQFTGSGLIDAPLCLQWSVKINAFYSIMAAAAGPCGGWIVWRLLKFRRGQAQRAKQRHELQERQRKARKDEKSLGAFVSSDAAPTAVTGIQLDDILEMQLEFIAAISVIACWVCFYYLMQLKAPEWYLILFLFLLLSVMYWSSVRPLQQSYSITRAYRQRLEVGRGVKNGGAGAAAGLATVNGSSTSIPHHAKYYDLDFILCTPSTYSVLLAFLRKEYSSENALFLQEVRSFVKQAKGAEERIQGWRVATTLHERMQSSGLGLSPMQSPLHAPRSDEDVMRKHSDAWRRGLSTIDSAIKKGGAVASVHPLNGASSASTTVILTPDRTSPTLPPPPSFSSSTPTQTIPPSGGHAFSSRSRRTTPRSSWNFRASVPIHPSLRAPAMLGVQGMNCPDADSQMKHGGGRKEPGMPSAIQQGVSGRSRTEGAMRASNSLTNVQLATFASRTTQHSSALPSGEEHDDPTSRSKTSSLQRKGFLEEHALAMDLRQAAIRIYEQFLESGSALYEINIPAELSVSLKWKVDHLRRWTPNKLPSNGVDEPVLGVSAGDQSPRGPSSPSQQLPLDSPRDRLASFGGIPDLTSSLPALSPPLPPPFSLSSLYLSAAQEIFLLLLRDSFTRFVLTREFALLLLAADEAELRRLEDQRGIELAAQASMDQAERTLDNRRAHPSRSGEAE